MPNLLENCSDCYQFTLSQFPDEITIVGGLPPSTPFYLWVTDKFNNTYSTGAIDTDSDGTISFSPLEEGFPAAWFNKDAGSFMIEAKPVQPYYGGIEQFTFNSISYDCIWVSFEFNNAPLNVIS